jgi:hypothetical protein
MTARPLRTLRGIATSATVRVRGRPEIADRFAITSRGVRYLDGTSG